MSATTTPARHGRMEEEGPEPAPMLRILLRLFEYSRPCARQRNALIVLVLLRACQLGLLAWMIGAIINGPVTRADFPALALATAGFTGFLLFTQLTFYLRGKLALQLGESIVHDLRADLFAHLLKMPVGFFARMPVGRILSRLTSDVEAVRTGVQEVLFVSLVNGGQMVVAGALMAWVDPVLFLIIILMAPVIFTMDRIFRIRLARVHREVQESFSKVTSTLAESVSGIRETQGFGRQRVNAGRFQKMIRDHGRLNLKLARTSGLFLPLLQLSSQFFMALLILVGGFRILHPEIDAPVAALVQFVFLAGVFFAPIQTLGQQFNNAIHAVAGAERVFRLLDTRPAWEDRPTAAALNNLRGAVRFESVRFAYEADRPALHDISFQVQPGQRVALVGHTGSGKSSIVNLIAKFYLPCSGTVRIDGVDLLDVTSASLHRQLGIVQQSNFLFSGSVLENIQFGRSGGATLQEARRAAASLGCLDLLDALPNGFATQVNERGTRLSLGQRQLVCFVRAMIADPRILILDEATSSIDTLTEARIQLALAKLLQGRTSFVVAHRLSTITGADLILVLEEGRIVEQGRHADLLKRGEVYAGLYSQFVKNSTGIAEPA